MFGFSSFSKTPFCTLPTSIQIYVVSIVETSNAIDIVDGVVIGNIVGNIVETVNSIDTVSKTMSATVVVLETANAQDVISNLVQVAVQIDEAGNAIDAQFATTYVILAVIENGNAVDVYYVEPIFRASGDVWHVSPRADYQHAMTRLDYWRVYE